tara:strand:+ start:102 stop:494 length:393 start_codon:yes stop_codon:yes gene_type:complete
MANVNIKDYYSYTGIRPKYNINGEELIYNDKMNNVKWNGGVAQDLNMHIYGVHYLPKTKKEIIKLSIEKKLYNKRKLFIQQNKTLINELEKVKNWNTFANSLLTFLNKNGFLTEKQINSALKMIDKLNKK